MNVFLAIFHTFFDIFQPICIFLQKKCLTPTLQERFERKFCFCKVTFFFLNLLQKFKICIQSFSLFLVIFAIFLLFIHSCIHSIILGIKFFITVADEQKQMNYEGKVCYQKYFNFCCIAIFFFNVFMASNEEVSVDQQVL